MYNCATGGLIGIRLGFTLETWQSEKIRPIKNTLQYTRSYQNRDAFCTGMSVGHSATLSREREACVACDFTSVTQKVLNVARH